MIAPDDKDWTWVLEARCPECALDTREVEPATVGERTRANAADWAALLDRKGTADVRERPAPDKWSPLEYACHVRDVFLRYDQRLLLMLGEEDPLFPNWDQDATAVEQRYGEQDPATVSAELQAAAKAIANDFDRVGEDEWPRTGRRSDGAQFTIATFSRYFIHDPIHHLNDVIPATR